MPKDGGETQLQEAVAELLAAVILAPAEWTAMPVGHVRLTPGQAGKLYRMGAKANWPDILILHGVLHGIELKTAEGRLSTGRKVRSRRFGHMRQVEGQQQVFPRLEAAGMQIYVCRSIDDVLAALKAWRIPTRQAVLPLERAA